jgi:hypothetical protein
MIFVFCLLTQDSLHLIKVETISFVLLLWHCLLGDHHKGHLGILGVWWRFEILDLGIFDNGIFDNGSLFCLLDLLLSWLLSCLVLGVTLMHILAILGLIEILGRIVLHENGFISDVVGGIGWVQLDTLSVVVDVTFDPRLVLNVESSHVESDPSVFEVSPVVGIVSFRNLGTWVFLLLYTFRLIGTILVVLPIVEVIAIIVSSTVVLEKSSLLFLDLLSWESLFSPVFFVLFLVVLSLATADLGFTEALEHLADDGFSLTFVHSLVEAGLEGRLFFFFENFTRCLILVVRQ